MQCFDCHKAIQDNFTNLEILKTEGGKARTLVNSDFCDPICLLHTLKAGRNVLEECKYPYDDSEKLETDPSEYTGPEIPCNYCNKVLEANDTIFTFIISHIISTSHDTLFFGQYCSNDCFNKEIDSFVQDYETIENMFKSIIEHYKSLTDTDEIIYHDAD
jgi:hypothetical protein